VIIVPFRVRGRIMGALTTAFSISHRRYDQRTLELVEEMANRAALALDNARLHDAAWQALRARDEMLRVVAHDLRNPLNTIGLSAGLLLESEPSEILANATQQLEIIKRSASRANRLIQDLLDVARMEAGKLTLERRPLAVLPLVEEAIELHRNQAEEQGLGLETRVQPRLPEIWADRERLLQVFANLLGNALKFTPQGGRITVAAQRDGPVIRFCVADTGCGIPEKDQELVFQPFWQAGNATRTSAGLGLSISRAIIHSHRGRIWLDSEEGKGTRVYFTVPIHHNRAG
jgi:signal transduction histidine kinase